MSGKVFDQLPEALDSEKPPKAEPYLFLYYHTMTFRDYWVQTKQWFPTDTNAIESAFSRITVHFEGLDNRISN